MILARNEQDRTQSFSFTAAAIQQDAFAETEKEDVRIQQLWEAISALQASAAQQATETTEIRNTTIINKDGDNYISYITQLLANITGSGCITVTSSTSSSGVTTYTIGLNESCLFVEC